MTTRKPRTLILPRVLAALERHGDQAVTADRIGRELKLPEKDVRISLQNYYHGHPEGCVEKISTGIYRWRCVAPGTTTPVINLPEPVPAAEPLDWGLPGVGDVTKDADGNWRDRNGTIVKSAAANPPDSAEAEADEQARNVPALALKRGGITYEDYDEDPKLKLLHRAPATIDEEPSYYFVDRRSQVWRAYKI